METFSALLVLCVGNSPVTGEFPAQRPVMRNFDVFFDLRLNKRLSNQSGRQWFETPSCSLLSHCNEEFSCWGRLLCWLSSLHYIDVIMITMASQITSLTVVYSIVYSDADQRKHQNSVSLAFVWGIHRGPVNSPHKGTVTRKMFPFDDVIMVTSQRLSPKSSSLGATMVKRNNVAQLLHTNYLLPVTQPARNIFIHFVQLQYTNCY